MASAYDRHLEVALAAVRAAADVADHVVVTIHWGRERHTCPDQTQTALARQLVAAGADVVAGHHAHVLQGIVEMDDALVAYGLGNFAFYARTPATRQSGVLTVTLGDDGVDGHRWAPAEIDQDGRPVPVATQAPLPTAEPLVTTADGPGCGPPADRPVGRNAPESGTSRSIR
jgi:poly-gamma-glutamate synthesis protein (capsule biosynthesis protein)